MESMRDEYDFSKGVRGKFYQPNLKLIPPVHLEPDVLDYLSERAKATGVTLNNLVNSILKKDIDLIEAAK